MKKSETSLLVSLLIVVGIVPAIADVIYEDDFSGSSSVNLNGQAPDVRPGTETWQVLETGYTTWKSDGSIEVPAANQNRNALLPFTPESGKVYTLSLTMNPQNSDYFSVGFTGTGSLNGSFTSSTEPAAAPWMFIQYDHTLVSRTYYGPGISGNLGVYPSAEGWGATVAVSIVLNTMASHWSVEWFINSESVRTYTYPENPTINYVGFGRQGRASGTVDNFKLVQETSLDTEPLPLFHLTKPDPAADTLWDIAELFQTPATFSAPEFEAEAVPGVTPLFYEGEVYTGMTTRVFAWIGIPTNGVGPFPGMVLVHGAGGTAYQEWVQLWMDRGYAAIAMDTAGHIPVHPDGADTGWVRHDDAGPLGWGGFDQIDDSLTDQWGYHAVAAVIRGHSLLRSYAQVDINRIGITGISWGGILTCNVAGLDDRFAFAVPVYGCGFLGEDSYWLGTEFRPMGETDALTWLNNWDPGRYVGRAKMPMFFVNGTNDKHFRLGSWQKTYRQPETDVTLCCKVRLAHSDIAGRVDEVFAYADACFQGTAPLPEINGLTRNGPEIMLTYAAGSTVTNAVLNYTTDSGAWTGRFWNVVSASLNTSIREVRATLPAGTSAYYINLFDENGMISSSEHEELTGYEQTVGSPSNLVVAVRSGEVQLGFDIQAATHYTVEASTNLLDESAWQDISGPMINYWNSPVEFSNSEEHACRYFRVRAYE